MGVGGLSGGKRGCGRLAAAGWLLHLAGGAAAGSSLLAPSASAPVGSSGCCGLRVGSRPGGREGSGGRGNYKARERRREEKADGRGWVERERVSEQR